MPSHTYRICGETLSAESEADLVLVGRTHPPRSLSPPPPPFPFPLSPSCGVNQPFFQPPTATEISELHGHSLVHWTDNIHLCRPSVPLPIIKKTGSSCPVHFCGIRLPVATAHSNNLLIYSRIILWRFPKPLLPPLDIGIRVEADREVF